MGLATGEFWLLRSQQGRSDTCCQQSKHISCIVHSPRKIRGRCLESGALDFKGYQQSFRAARAAAARRILRPEFWVGILLVTQENILLLYAVFLSIKSLAVFRDSKWRHPDDGKHLKIGLLRLASGHLELLCVVWYVQ